jgi:hypothetical protein
MQRSIFEARGARPVSSIRHAPSVFRHPAGVDGQPASGLDHGAWVVGHSPSVVRGRFSANGRNSSATRGRGPADCRRKISKFARLAGAFMMLALAACGDRPVHEISRVRENGRMLRVDAPIEERFRSGHFTRSPMRTGERPAVNLAWDAPVGWTEIPGTGMRHVTFRFGTGGECYILFLPGGGGGVARNINRWRRQMNQPPLDAAAIAALPHTPILGAKSPVLEAYSPDDRGLLATYAQVPGRTLFVKLTGPALEVRKQKEAFSAFCRSLRIVP